MSRLIVEALKGVAATVDSSTDKYKGPVGVKKSNDKSPCQVTFLISHAIVGPKIACLFRKYDNSDYSITAGDTIIVPYKVDDPNSHFLDYGKGYSVTVVSVKSGEEEDEKFVCEVRIN